MSNKVGLEGRAYINTAARANPTWVLITDVRNITIGAEKTLADMTTRDSNKFRQKKAAIKEMVPELDLLWDNASNSHALLRAAFFADTVVDILILDGPVATVGSQGFRGQYEVASFGRSEQLEEGMGINVKLELSADADYVFWFTVE